jgi:hypothetical protein
MPKEIHKQIIKEESNGRIKWKKTSNGRNSHRELESGANKNKAPKVMEEWSW